MRIISGKLKGRKLDTFKGDEIRPTGEKVKEAVFSMLDGYFNESVVADVFSGTGSLGLEALSRGAAICYFGDNSGESLRLIGSNVKKCGVQEQSRIIPGGFEKVLSKIPEKADVIFLDPPYGMGLMEKCLEKIRELDVLAEDGIIVCEHGRAENPPDVLFGFTKIKEKKYGKVLISLYG